MRAETYTNPRQSLGFLLHQSAINWRRALAGELRPIGLTPVQFFMLGSTSRLTSSNDQGPMQKDVAEDTGVDVNVVSQVVRQIEQRGLLARTRHEGDGRAFRLQLMPAGRQKLHEALVAVRKVDTAFFHAVTDSDLQDKLGKLA